MLGYVNQAVDDAAKKVVGALGLIAGVAEAAGGRLTAEQRVSDVARESVEV